MEILVIGAGLVGSALGERAGVRAVVTRSVDGDIRNRRQIQALVAMHRPKWIVLSAAISHVDQCEQEPDQAWDINVRGAENVAQAARDTGARLIFISTDYVFDGTASSPYEIDAPRNAVNVYGKTKIAAEDAVRKIVPDVTIARVSWVFGIHRPCYATRMLEEVARTHRWSDTVTKFSCPSYNRDLAEMLIGLIDRNASGVFHVCNSPGVTRLDMARALAEAAGIREVEFQVIPEPVNLAARRPNFTPLSVASVEAIGIRTRHWSEALPEFVAEMKKKSGQWPVISGQ